jgi:hypothetical protein
MFQPTSKKKGALSSFLRHFVPLQVEYLAEGQQRFAVFSAFVLEVEDVWFLVTAGHVLIELEELRASKGVSNLRGWLLDANHSEAPHVERLPYAIADEAGWKLDENGLDFGVLPLSELIVTQLKKNGVRSLGEDAWSGQPPSDASYWLVGSPMEHHKFPGTETKHIEILNCLQSVKPLNVFPSDLEREPGHSFVAEIGGADVIKSVVGMSGGPIFAGRNNADEKSFTYWLVAIQSSWIPQRRIILGCSAWALADGLRKTMLAIRDENARDGNGS